MGASDSVQGREVAFASMTARIVAISITHCVLIGPVAVTGLIPGFPTSTYVIMHVLYFRNHGVNFVFYTSAECYNVLSIFFEKLRKWGSKFATLNLV